MDTTLADELTHLLNRHSQENNSGTPDFILAAYMLGALRLFEATTVQRDAWWGFEPKISGIPAVDGDDDGPFFVTVNTDPPKPPYGSPERAEYDRGRGA